MPYPTHSVPSHARRLGVLLALALIAGGLVHAFGPHPAIAAPAHAFAFGGPDNGQFLLDGQPFQIRAGEMHPSRIPPAYWRQRIAMAKAMGLNTISMYVFWNRHEETEGRFDFATGDRNLGEFLRLAREEGMWVILRGGPYGCGEWDLGGLPWWLLKTPDIQLRSLDPRFTGPAARYLHELAQVVRPNLAANGGPIVMIQLENEYGSYNRHVPGYPAWLRDRWIAEGVPGPFCTSDGASVIGLKDSTLPGVAVGLDPGMREADWTLARQMNPGVPVYGAEIYPGWLRHWGEAPWKPTDLTAALKFFMETGKSFSLYMFHGGTNFGLTAGANAQPDFKPDVTSYDYAGPLDEQGRPTPAYHALRAQIASYLPREKLPEIPAVVPAQAVAPIVLERWSSLWAQLPAPVAAPQPLGFEAMGQNQGIVLYRTRLPAGPGGKLALTVRDFAQVFLDGKRIGVIDRREGPQEVTLPATAQPATLDVLVEAMGHVNFLLGMESDRKGLAAPVQLRGKILSGWQMFHLPLGEDWAPAPTAADPRQGVVFRGTFPLDAPADTFLDLGGYGKGYVWVNGHLLGRYWSIGPQQSLYCPAPWLKPGTNTIVVLDLLDAGEAKAAPIPGRESPRYTTPAPKPAASVP